MNEILFIAITVLALAIILLAFRLGTHCLVGVVVAYLLVANLFASKLTTVFGVTSSLAIPIYAAIFLATDATAEHHGKGAAYRLVWIGFLTQGILVVFSQLAAAASTISVPDVQAAANALSTIFSFVPRIVLGSFVAYIVSQNFDILFYHRLKESFQGRRLWLRNCVSTSVSQGLDTLIFLLIAFWGKVPEFWTFVFFVWLVKVGVALADTPFIYLTYFVLGKKIARSGKRLEGENN